MARLVKDKKEIQWPPTYQYGPKDNPALYVESLLEEIEDLKDYNDKLHKQNERLRILLNPSRYELRGGVEFGLKPKRVSDKVRKNGEG